MNTTNETSKPGEDHAGVITHPPFLYLGGLAAAMILDSLFPLGAGTFAAGWPQIIAGFVIFGLAIGMVMLAASSFHRHGTSVPTHTPTTALVTEGFYRHSRNPIYVALTVAYGGLAIMLNSGWAFLVLPVVLWVMSWGVIAREEVYLERKFGAAYIGYKARTPRWLRLW